MSAASRLTKEHREHLATSGLVNDEDVTSYRSIDHKSARRAVNRRVLSGGIAIEYYRPDGTRADFVRFRPDEPRLVKGEKLKYEQPWKKPTEPYFPRRAWPLLRDASRPLYFVEGEKKSDAVAMLGYAVIGAPGVDNFHDPDAPERMRPLVYQHATIEGRRCVVLFDKEARDPLHNVHGSARRLAWRLLRSGASEVTLAAPSGDEKGIDDLLVAKGEAAARAAIETTQPIEPLDPTTKDKRTKIDVSIERTDETVVDEVLDVLSREPRLYSRGTMLVRVLDPVGLPAGLCHRKTEPASIEQIPRSMVAEWIDKHARFVRTTEEGEKPTRLPSDVVQKVIDRHRWPKLRHLEVMVEAPTLLATGHVLEAPGYDASSGVFLAGEAVGVPEKPTREDVRAALDVLADLVRDFPFKAPEHRSAWLASVLSPLARFAHEGPAPLFLFDASAPGTGKTLLASCAAVIATGRALPLDSLPVLNGAIDNRELRKEILSWALAGRRVICLDNAKDAPLGGAELERATTATMVGGRVLGESRDWEGPLFATWLVTANNAVIEGDMHRRVCHIRLEADVEKPAERTFDRDLVAYVHANRPKLTRAALTVLRGYCAADKPPQSLKPWGSFEGWSAIVRAAIVWAGWPDPIDTQRELSRTNGERADLERALVGAWRYYAIGKANGLTVSEFFAELGHSDEDDDRATQTRAVLEGLGVPMAEPKTRGQKLGMVLNEVRGRVYSVDSTQRRIEVSGAGHGGVKRWAVLSSAPRMVVGGGTLVSLAGGEKDVRQNEARAVDGAQENLSRPSVVRDTPTTHHPRAVDDGYRVDWQDETDPADAHLVGTA